MPSTIARSQSDRAPLRFGGTKDSWMWLQQIYSNCHMTLLTSSLLKGVEFPHWKFLMGCPCETFDTTSFLFSLSQIPTWSISISFWVWYSRCLSNFLHSLTLHKVLKLEIFLYCFIFCLLGFWYSVQRTEAKKKNVCIEYRCELITSCMKTLIEMAGL